MAVVSDAESLNRAIRHVSDGWIPPQVEVLERISSRLEAGDYQEDRQALTSDLKEDFSLYMYCLRELSKMIQQERNGREQSEIEPKAESSSRQTPRELLESASLEDLRTILLRSPQEISKHSIDRINEFQALRFRESLLSASTAEVLAESLMVDPEDGFSCGLLRQLGLCLIAWNYPRVYSRAVEKLSPGRTLEASLKRVLGFSPSLLGLTFARHWNFTDEVVIAVGNGKKRLSGKFAFSGDKSTETTLASESVGETLAKICEVGEALARANDPDHYPTALADWETAQEMIAQQLGPNGISTIYLRAQENLKHYVKHTPELFNFAESTVVQERIADSQYSSSLIEKNTHLRHIPAEIREELKALYAKFRPKKILKSNIRQLLNEIAPKAGFHRMCIYMYDPEKQALAPSMKVGELSAERLRPIRINSVLAQYDLIASAYSLRSPLREETVSEEGHRSTLIASALGQKTPVGVFYMETIPEFNTKVDADPMQLFRAFRQCLQDCLNLK